MSKQDVEIPMSDGTALRGVLYRPTADGGDVAGPGIVMSHGFSAVKEMALPAYAEIFASAGSTVLLYDHRNLGSSGGEPRQQINPWLQMSDMQHALAWLGEQDGVDSSRLGLWGSSFSGGEALILGSIDRRVKAVVANVPFAGIPGTNYAADTSQTVDAISEAINSGAFADPNDQTIMGPFSVVTEDGNELPPFLGHPESAEWFLREGAGTTWRNEVTLANAFGTEPPFDPGMCVAHLRCPALFVVASGDNVAEAGVALASFERAPEPKQLLVVDGDHFTPYSGEARDAASAAAVAWFAEHL